MTYLLYGTESFLIKQEIDKIQKKDNIGDISIVKYDLTDTLIDKIIDECNSISLFEDKKMIIVENTNIFNRVKSETDEDESKNKKNDYTVLIEYLNNQNTDVILIFVNNQATIDNSKKITKLLKNKGIIKEFNTVNVKEYVKKMFSEYQISYNEIALLINRVGNDLNLLNKEIEKIKTYKDDNFKITKEDIINLTSKNIDLDIFNFVDKIVTKNKDEAMTIYKEMLVQNNDPTKIIGLLASKLRLMYQAHELSNMGYSQVNISNVLNVKKYPVELALEASCRTNSKTLLKYLKDLAELEINIKTGIIDGQLGIQLFILSI